MIAKIIELISSKEAVAAHRTTSFAILIAISGFLANDYFKHKEDLRDKQTETYVTLERILTKLEIIEGSIGNIYTKQEAREYRAEINRRFSEITSRINSVEKQ